MYQLGCRIAKEAYEAYVSQGFLNDMHTALCYIRLAESIEESGQTDVINLSALKAKLVEQVKNSITRNKSEWETSYVCKPSQFFNSKNSIFMPTIKNSPTMSVHSLKKRSFPMARGLFLGGGRTTPNNGQSQKTGGKAMVYW